MNSGERKLQSVLRRALLKFAVWRREVLATFICLSYHDCARQILPQHREKME